MSLTNLDIISRKKICEQIGISRDTIRNWIEKRDFPKSLKSSGRDPFFQLKEVNEWFLKHVENNENLFSRLDTNYKTFLKGKLNEINHLLSYYPEFLRKVRKRE